MKRPIDRLVVSILGFVMVLVPGLRLGPDHGQDRQHPAALRAVGLGRLAEQTSQDMAVEEINSAGGIKSLGGAKIQMLYADSSPSRKRAWPRPNASSTPKRSTS